MFIANAVIYGSLAMIAMNGTSFPSSLDAVVWITVATSLVARRLDITRLNGQTAGGEPATLAHWRTYAAAVIIVTALASLLAHAIAGS
jgi:hypothetical protein